VHDKRRKTLPVMVDMLPNLGFQSGEGRSRPHSAERSRPLRSVRPTGVTNPIANILETVPSGAGKSFAVLLPALGIRDRVRGQGTTALVSPSSSTTARPRRYIECGPWTLRRLQLRATSGVQPFEWREDDEPLEETSAVLSACCSICSTSEPSRKRLSEKEGSHRGRPLQGLSRGARAPT